ncbi:hypothetical protein [Massilia oculi]|uniref:hypothetical protein n=1 Tax=Massilia oculi TaxID=945844 RepID=UPI001AAEDFA1|nr:hypothetical protein [Massilia oculi]
MSIKQHKRARNLDDKAIEQIVEMLDNWSGPKLTWDMLIQKILLRLRSSYTRQALHNHTRIKEAFAARKRNMPLANMQGGQLQTPEQLRIVRLESEIDRLKRENNNLLEQFQRWVYNGYLKQMDERMRDFMNQPLPPVHRDPSNVHRINKKN